MARVLVVGADPDQVDYSDPALPPGLDAALIRRGIALALAGLRAAGHEATALAIPAQATGIETLSAVLAREAPDCVVVGGGLRLPPRHLPLFEAVLNAVARAPSRPAIALTGRPDEAPAAVARVLGGLPPDQ